MNMAPLVDVVFLLLVFFLLTSSLVRFQTLDLRLAAAVVPRTQDQETGIVIRINDRGEVTLGGEPVLVAEIPRVMTERFDVGPETIAVILSAPEVGLQSLVTVLERVRETGVGDVRIGGM